VLQAATALVEHWRNPAWAHGIEFERDCAPGSVKARTVELTDALAERVEEVKR
jgi:hypothetical protein